ncbi:MAG: PAS domain-containing protein, partial [Gloeomargarita sp. SKYB31]|nr:PAS domain-containing protein [Gloeomargarita sp. SKYB31]
MDQAVFGLLLQGATSQLQAGIEVAQVIRSLMVRLQQQWGCKQIALCQGQQMILQVGEYTAIAALPPTWQAQKIIQDLGERWCLPVIVRQQGSGWLVIDWVTSPGEMIYQQAVMLAAHIGLIIQATSWERMQPELADQPYYFLLNSLPIGVGLTNAHGECIYANNALMKMLQVPMQNLLEHGWINSTHPDDHQRVHEMWQAILQNPQDRELEYRIQQPNGEVIWVHSYLTVLRNDAGQVVGFLSAMADITQAKRLEQMLIQSEQKYRNLVEYQTDLLVYSLPDTTITFANPALCHALGYTLDEIVGLKWDHFITQPEDLAALQKRIQALTPANPIFSFTKPIRNKRGQILYVECITLGIFDEQRQLLAIQSVGRDVTELRRAEQELRDSRGFLATLVQNVPGMVYRYHPQTPERPAYLSYVSDYAEEIFELPVGEIMIDPHAFWQKHTHPDDLEKLSSSVQAAVQGRLPWHCEWRIITPSGKLKWLEGRSQMRQ